jgi:hypothetical protein
VNKTISVEIKLKITEKRKTAVKASALAWNIACPVPQFPNYTPMYALFIRYSAIFALLLLL